MKKVFLSYTAKLRLKKALKIIGIVLAAILLLLIMRFVYLQRFVVYDENGVHLEYDRIDTAVQQETVPPTGEFVLEQESAVGETIEAPVEGKLSALKGVYLTYEQVLDEEIRAAVTEKLEDATALLMDVKTPTGKYLYATALPGTDRSQTDLTQWIRELSKRHDLTLVARLPAFSDSAHALIDFSQSLPIKGGALWMDKNGSYWLDPAGEDVAEYLVSQARELYQLGFDEIVFDGFDFPDSVNIVYPSSPGGDEAMLACAQEVAKQVQNYEIPVSFISQTSQIIGLSSRAFIAAETGEMVSQTVREYSLLLPGNDARLVFLTASRDTRFETYSVLSPFTMEEE